MASDYKTHWINKTRLQLNLWNQELPIVLDLDDFNQFSPNVINGWNQLLELKSTVPQLKVNLFTICMGKTGVTEQWLEKLLSEHKEWIELHYHGFNHKRNECLQRKEIILPFSQFFYKSFRPGWWQIDQETADLFSREGYVLALRKAEGGDSIQAPRKYLYDEGLQILPNFAYQHTNFLAIHGHVWGADYLSGIPHLRSVFDEYFAQSDYKFLSEVL